ncbi:helix-turn-helix domain-containing protein [Nocardia sp. NPDC004722]
MTRANPVEEPIGELIRRLRRERGLTQKSLADKAKCSRSLIQQIESGTRVPQLSLRESLSAALGVALPTGSRATPSGGHADSGTDALRMRFNVLLGQDPVAAEHALRIAERLIGAKSADADLEPLRAIAVRQLRHAEDVLAQVPARSVTVLEWNTVADWRMLIEQATRSVCSIHVAGFAVLGGEIGEEYHASIYRLASRTGPAKLDIRRIYVLDTISELWPYDEKLWRLARAGVENLLVRRDDVPGAAGLMLVDDRFAILGEYDHARETRLATRFSAMAHEIRFLRGRFEKLYALGSQRRAIPVNKLLTRPPLEHHTRIDEPECREKFRAALTEAWNLLPHSGS